MTFRWRRYTATPVKAGRVLRLRRNGARRRGRRAARDPNVANGAARRWPGASVPPPNSSPTRDRFDCDSSIPETTSIIKWDGTVGHAQCCEVNRRVGARERRLQPVDPVRVVPALHGWSRVDHQTDDTHAHWVTKIGGVSREFDTEITEQHPDERIAWKSTDGTTHAGVVTFHRLGEGETKVTVQLDWMAEGIVEKAGALVGVDDHQVKADMVNFKTYIEEHGHADGAWRGDVNNPRT